MTELLSIYSRLPQAYYVLYGLMAEAEPESCISHRKMPTFQEHVKFVNSYPYAGWYLIEDDMEPIGMCYISLQREVGIRIFKRHQYKGYGKIAISKLREKYPGILYANINPQNKASIRFFKGLGARLLQYTYELS